MFLVGASNPKYDKATLALLREIKRLEKEPLTPNVRKAKP
jgi:hypothetical protein